MMLVMLSITIFHIQSKIMSIESVVQDAQMLLELPIGNILLWFCRSTLSNHFTFSLITEKHAKCVNDLIKVLEGSGNEVPDDLFKLKPNNRKKNGYSRGGRSNNGNNYGR